MPATQPLGLDEAAQGALMERRIQRERQARKAAEQLLEDKSREVYAALQTVRESESRLQMALWASGEGIWEWRAGDRLFRLDRLELDGRSVQWKARSLPEVEQEVHPEDREALRLGWQLHLNGSRPEVDIAFRLHDAGRYRWVRVRGRASSRDKAGRVQHLIGTIKDITAQRGAEESLRLMAHAFSSMRDGLAVVDAHWRIVEVNEALCKLFALASAQLLGQSLLRFVDLGDLLLDRLIGHEGWRAERVLVRGAQRTPVEVSATAVADGADAQPNFIVALRDIRTQKSVLARLEHMATVDRTTGLPNRAAIEEHIQRLLEQAGLAPELGLLFVGVDGFKVINDSFGHDTGDAALERFGALLKQAMAAATLVGRWGGDKFVVVLQRGSGEDDLRAAAHAVHELLRQPLKVGQHEVAVGATMGAVLAPRDGTVAGTLLRRGETALYGAKDEARGQLRFYDLALEGDPQRRLRMLSLLRTDTERAGFRFAAQSKVDRHEQVVGAELLMRWATDAFGAVSPAEFIPLAERVGLIDQMGRQAVHAAARLVARAAQAGHALHVAVNLSPKQLLRGDIEHTLLSACREHGIAASSLELEVTESAFVSGVGAVQPLLQRLKAAGFTLALDDFGTGYSSLSYLQNLPFDKVKIDRSFVLGLERSERGPPILSAIVALCRALGMRTVAEGVETRPQFEALCALGVDEFQGYLFARPVFTYEWLEQLARAAPARPAVQPAPQGPAARWTGGIVLRDVQPPAGGDAR
ncbi:MAG: EAL domain-containing protein [Rubrivivax sp.]|nr:EAL domain-containing protein [Rubrivivax sp.]